MFYIIVILAGIFAMPASAQSVKEQLLGAWAFASCDTGDPWCAGGNGIHFLNGSGHYATMITARGRPKAPGDQPGANVASRNAVTPEQYKAMAIGVAANFGTWSVNEANKTITYHFDGALFPNGEGTEVTAPFSISGDELRVGAPPRQGVWRRIAK